MSFWSLEGCGRRVRGEIPTLRCLTTDTNPWLKALTERAEFFASYKASGADNTLCIIKPDNEVWREKGKRELKILIRG